jgi:hypothetical protein
MRTGYYIYDRAAHVSEVDCQKWARWIETGNDAAKHSWVGMAQVVTTFPGKRDWAGVVQFMATAVGPGRYIWKPGFSVCFVMDLDGSDVEEAQYCKGGLEQGEAMHARVLARRRCKDLENNGQGVETSIIGELMMDLVRDRLMAPKGFKHSSRPLHHAGLLRFYGRGQRLASLQG